MMCCSLVIYSGIVEKSGQTGRFLFYLIQKEYLFFMPSAHPLSSPIQHDTAYSRIASWYAQNLPASHLHQAVIPHLLSLIVSVQTEQRQRIVDIACGEGVFTRALARTFLPAHLIGIDASARLITLARQQEQRAHDCIDYGQDDMRTLASLGDESVQLLTCCLGFTDVDDLAAVYRAIARVLQPGGRLVYAIPHPCGLCSTSDGHLEPGPYSYYEETCWCSQNVRSVRAHVPNWHRPLSTYLNLAREAGLLLETLLEPRPGSEAVQAIPDYATVPYALVVGMQKQGR
jgi:SAM-dependent methyltransferase